MLDFNQFTAPWLNNGYIKLKESGYINVSDQSNYPEVFR